MEGAGNGNDEVTECGEEGVEAYIDAAGAVAVGEIGGQEDGDEGDEVWRSREGLRC